MQDVEYNTIFFGEKRAKNHFYQNKTNWALTIINCSHRPGCPDQPFCARYLEVFFLLHRCISLSIRRKHMQPKADGGKIFLTKPNHEYIRTIFSSPMTLGKSIQRKLASCTVCSHGSISGSTWLSRVNYTTYYLIKTAADRVGLNVLPSSFYVGFIPIFFDRHPERQTCAPRWDRHAFLKLAHTQVRIYGFL